MKIIDRLIFLLIRKPVKIAMHTILADRLSSEAISVLYQDMWANYKIGVADLEKQETLGSTLMVRLSLLTLTVFEQLLARDFPHDEAIQLTARMIWIVYEKITDKFWVFTRIFSRKPMKRVRKVMNFFIKFFPYQSPGYEMEIVRADDAEYAFNVHKCPAANYFRKHGRGDLCVASWCDLDYPLADKWGVALKRDKMLAKGDMLCNFQFAPKERKGIN